MQLPRKLIRSGVGPAAVLTWGMIAVDAALAAPSLTAVDWRSYVDGRSIADWPSWLLVGSIVLLVVGLILRVLRAGNATRDSGPGDAAIETDVLYTRRIGNMPIEPPARIDAPR